jgi:uncharacterized protein YpmS
MNNSYQIIALLIRTVEDYILQKKNVRVKIDPIQIITNQDQLNKLIDAYNYIENDNAISKN